MPNNNTLKLLAIPLLLLLATACQEERDQFGLNYLNPNENLHLQVEQFSNLTASIDTASGYNRVIGFAQYAFGERKNSYFGNSKTAVVTQMIPTASSANGYEVGKTNIEKVVFRFKIMPNHSEHPFHISIRSMNQAITTSVGEMDIATLVANSSELLTHKFDKVDKPILVIENDSKLKEYAKNAMDTLVARAFSATDLINRFHGIMISATSDDPNGYMANLYLADRLTGFWVYWKPDSTKNELDSMGFAPSSLANRFYRIEHDPATSTLAQHLAKTPDERTNLSEIPLVADAGSKMTLSMQSVIDGFATRDFFTIARAELIIPAITGHEPDTLVSRIIAFSSDGTRLFKLTDQALSENLFGGYFDRHINAYRLNITAYIDEILHQKGMPPLLYLYAVGRYPGTGVVRLTANDPKNPPRILISWTQL